MAERKIYWFVEPLDTWTNSVIYSEISNSLGSEQVQYELLVDKGSFFDEVNVWEVPHSIITKLYRNKRELNLNFRVYNRANNRGIAKLWRFEDPAYRKTRKKSF